MIQGYLRGKTHSALILIQVILHHLELSLVSAAVLEP